MRNFLRNACLIVFVSIMFCLGTSCMAIGLPEWFYPVIGGVTGAVICFATYKGVDE